MFEISTNDAQPELCENSYMTDEDAEPLLYRQLMAIKPAGLSPNKWLTEAGINRSFFSDLRRSGNARMATVAKLLEIAGVSQAEFYGLEAPETSAGAAAAEQVSRNLPFRADTEKRDIPVVGTAMGSDFELSHDGTMAFSEVTELSLDEVHDYARRPKALEGRKDVYVLMAVGESMSPRFNPGDPAYVDPRATPRIGDDVVVYLRREEGEEERVYSALLKELVRSTSTFVELRQHNPALTFTVERKAISQIHRIIPWRELTLF